DRCRCRWLWNRAARSRRPACCLEDRPAPLDRRVGQYASRTAAWRRPAGSSRWRPRRRRQRARTGQRGGEPSGGEVTPEILKDNGGGGGVELTALAEAPWIAALSADDGFGFLRGQALVPQLDRQRQHAAGDSGEVASAECLGSLRAVGVQRQAHHETIHL